MRKGPPAPAVSIVYILATTEWIPFKFGTCMQWLRKFFLHMTSLHFDQSEKSHHQKHVFKRGVLYG